MQNKTESLKRKSFTPILFETRDLIRLVKDRRCLWDRLDQDYRDRTLKDAAWLEIYKVIEPDYDNLSEDIKTSVGLQITKKWYNVRDSFVKSKKHDNRNKPYIYSKLLTFLEPVYFEDPNKQYKKETEEPWLNEVFVVDESEQSEPKRQKTEFENTSRTDNDESILSALTNLLNKDDDDDLAFFKSITPALKKLSEDSKMEFRIKVMNVLQNLRNKEKNAVSVKIEFNNDEEEFQSD